MDKLNSLKLDPKTAKLLALGGVCVTALLMARSDKGPELLKGFAAVLAASAPFMKVM